MWNVRLMEPSALQKRGGMPTHVVGSGTDCVVSVRPKTADGNGASEQPDVHALEEARRLVGSPIRLLTRSGRTNGACAGVACSVVVRLASSVGAASRSAEQARGGPQCLSTSRL